MYSVLNTLSEYTYFYISKNIESLQCIINITTFYYQACRNKKNPGVGGGSLSKNVDQVG